VPSKLQWLTKIISTLRLRDKPLSLNLHYEGTSTNSWHCDSLHYDAYRLHYEAAWTDSWTHHQCFHKHPTLIEAAKCAMPYGAGWYVIAVNGGTPRQLTDAEDKIVDEFRFGT
jgi:hypothetical protein